MEVNDESLRAFKAAVPYTAPDDRIWELERELAQLRDAYDAARQDLDVAKRNVASANTRLDCALTKGNRLRNVMGMLRSPDEETRLLMHAAADEWDEFLRITTDSRASEAPGDTP